MDTIINFLSDVQNVAWVAAVGAGIGCIIIFAPAFFKRSVKWHS
jgi:hypothetical protein